MDKLVCWVQYHSSTLLCSEAKVCSVDDGTRTLAGSAHHNDFAAAGWICWMWQNIHEVGTGPVLLEWSMLYICQSLSWEMLTLGQLGHLRPVKIARPATSGYPSVHGYGYDLGMFNLFAILFIRSILWSFPLCDCVWNDPLPCWELNPSGKLDTKSPPIWSGIPVQDWIDMDLL